MYWYWLQVWEHFLLAGGAKGKRLALPNAEIMIHQPSGGAERPGDRNSYCSRTVFLRRRERVKSRYSSENTGQTT